jgi:hypothetical protein
MRRHAAQAEPCAVSGADAQLAPSREFNRRRKSLQ